MTEVSTCILNCDIGISEFELQSRFCVYLWTNTLSVIHWPSTEPSIKGCTCVNKRKNSGSRWTLNNTITRAQTAWISWRQDARVRTSLLWVLSDPRLSNLAKMRKKYCYGRRRTWCQYSSLSPSPTHLSHTRNITLSRIKRERLYFYKEVYLSLCWLCPACECIFVNVHA